MQTDPGEDSLLDLFRSRSWHSWNSPLMQNPYFKYKIHHFNTKFIGILGNHRLYKLPPAGGSVWIVAVALVKVAVPEATGGVTQEFRERWAVDIAIKLALRF